MSPDLSYLHQIPRIHDGLDYLLANDPVFTTLGVDYKTFDWPYFGADFAGLVRIVIGQQLSTHVADLLWQRFENTMPCITPNAVMALHDDDMREFGLSSQKAGYIRGLAEAIRAGRFDPAALEHLSDEGVYEAITALKGFGRWSAEIYMMFGLARPNVWPAGDLGIQVGLQKYLGLSERPDEKRVQREGERFEPYRTAASLLLWYMKSNADINVA